MENSSMAAAKKHVEEIRKNTFWIGVGKNTLSKPLSMAVKYLSAELYSKDVHFLMELIQNAEDNEYLEGVDPSLEFLITSQDVTATGAPATLMVFNNEKGFSRRNIESICSVGESTKAGNRKRGYIGEKGIGFKSVFLLTARPYIFSNGYQIRFSETACAECDIAYIVPEWVDNTPCISDLQKIYGSRPLPTTTLILPLKADKVKAVKDQLSSLHPELLLFLSKIKKLSVKEDNEDHRLNTVRAISISSEKDFVSRKSIDAESYTVHLAAAEGGNDMEGECRYYMWKQRFPVKKENKVEKRMDIEDWSITLAFPFGKRLDRGMSSAGIYAFLPTETVTNLPFIIQADFLLPSSRETILWDDKWNQGILDCVPNAFIDAFVALVKTSENAPPSTLASMFEFLPVKSSSHPKLNVIREKIKEKMLQQSIILSESHSSQKFFHKTSEVGRLLPDFWKILLKAKEQGAKLHNLSSHGKHILHSSFDTRKYNAVLNFLDIEYVDFDWYPKCIGSCNLVMGVGEDVYVELLSLLAKNWKTSQFDRGTVRNIPLLKYVDASGAVSLMTINEAASSSYSLLQSLNSTHTSWLIDWSKEFISASRFSFLPKKLQEGCQGVNDVLIWLRDHVNVKTVNVAMYASLLTDKLRRSSSRNIFVFAHFIYQSFSKGFLIKPEVMQLCSQMPVVDKFGGVSVKRKGMLVPANGSKWVELLGNNPWKEEEFVELSEEYLHSGKYAGQLTPQQELIKFLKVYAGASDIPDIRPPNSSLSAVSGPLNKENAFLLLNWIKSLRSRVSQMPREFLSCLESGSWLKVTVSGSAGYKSPSQSFLPSESWGNLLQNGSDMVDIPLVDVRFYDYKIGNYQEELKLLGVMTEFSQACKFIGNHLMTMASQHELTKSKFFAMLNFIRFLRSKCLPGDEFIKSVQSESWVWTSCGLMAPVNTVLYDTCWEAASALSQLPFMDESYYGRDIFGYKEELNLLGVRTEFKENYQFIIDRVKPAGRLDGLSPKSLICALRCICNFQESDRLVAALKQAKCLKTNMGFLTPADSFLFDDQWGCLLEVFDDFPFIDKNVYERNLCQYKDALQKIGVVVDLVGVIKKFSALFRQRVDSNSFTEKTAVSFIACYRDLIARQILPESLRASIQELRWLRTRLGDRRSPKDCILFSSDWLPISLIARLPFLDDSVSCYGEGINKWKDELQSMGVVIDFSEGSELVLSHISLPKDPKGITASSVISLLNCIKISKLKMKESSLEASLKQLRQTKWLKTTFGYMCPGESMLFNKERTLQLYDGPFIDEEFYGKLSNYRAELVTLGVIIDCYDIKATSLLSSHLKSLTEFAKLQRIYEFLREANWKHNEGADAKIWFPTSSNCGMWVSPKDCVLHDVDGLFKSRLHVLAETNYKPTLFMFFSITFDVKSKPSTDDFCSLWKDWENSKCYVSLDECCAFWGHVVNRWNSKNKDGNTFIESVAKIPALSAGATVIHLVSKQDVFIPDDLLLKDLFENASSKALFIWCPKKSLSSVSRQKLLPIYAKLGVRKISEAVSITEQSDLKCAEWKQVTLKDVFIVKGLIMIILGFLADPEVNIEVKNRLDKVKELLNVVAYEMPKPITVSYSLKMTSGDTVNVEASQMLLWQREKSEFFSQKVDKSGGRKNVLAYAMMFSDVVSRGLLWDNEDLIPRLSELIKFGYLMDFDEDAVAYFLKSKNLQMFAEDEEFLSSIFPSS